MLSVDEIVNDFITHRKLVENKNTVRSGIAPTSSSATVADE